MSEDKIERLTHQYIWAIQSDGDWYMSAVKFAQRGLYKHFVIVTNGAIDRVERQIEGPARLDIRSRVFIRIALWKELNGRSIDVTNHDADIAIDCKFWPYAEPVRNTEDNIQSSLIEIETQQENEMSNAMPFEMKYMVFGRDVATMSEEDLIQAIKHVEGEISKLKEVKTESKKIKSKIDAMTEALANIVNLLDSM